MAASDSRPVPRKNVAFRFYFPIRKNDGTLITTWAGQDSEVSLDGGAFADCTNEATEIGTSGVGYIDLTNTEMNADSVVYKLTVTNTGALPLVVSFFPEESGDYRADATMISGDSSAADNAKSFFDGTGYAGTNNVIPTVTTVTNQLTGAAIATAVWQDATAGDFTAASSIGKSLYTSGAVPGAAGGLFIAGTNAATTVTTSLTTTFTGNLTGSVGSVTGAVGSVTGNVGGNVTGSVGSVASGGITSASFGAGAIDAAAIATDAIGANEVSAAAVTKIQSGLSTLDAAGVRSAVGLASANLDTQLDALPTAAENAAAVADEFATASDAVEASPTPTTTAFAGSTSLSDQDDFYNGSVVVFTAGDLDGIARKITDYTGSTRLITVSPAFPAAPAAADTFRIIGRID